MLIIKYQLKQNYMKPNFQLRCKLKTYFIAVLCMISFSAIQAQTRDISGTVSADGQPLPGASIVIKGTTVGTQTDFDGNFTISATSDATLVFSYLGYFNQEILAGNQSSIDVSMQEDAAELEEVVVIGYGTVAKKDLTGSVVYVKSEELEKIQVPSFEGALVGRAAGVQIVSSEGGPDAGFKVRVRGGTSVNASSDPLYVVDGFPLSGSQQGNNIGLGNSSTSPLASIDPSNIESVTILKDASATAIYGSRGANGVVIITTKSGKKGRAQLNYEGFTGISTLSNRIDMLSPQEFVDWRLEYSPWETRAIPEDELAEAYRDANGNPVPLNDPRLIITDWQDEITRPAVTIFNKISMGGGAENNSYSASFSHLNQEGIIKNSDFERYNLNLNVNQNITDKLKSGINVNLGITKRNGIVTAAGENANGRSALITNALAFAPVQGLTQDDSAQYDEDGRLVSVRGGDIINPTRQLEGDTNRGNGVQTFAGAFLEYQIFENLKFKSSLGGFANRNKGQAYFSEQYGWGASAGGRAFTNLNQSEGITVTHNLNYNKSFGNHNLDATAVYEQQENSFEFTNTASTGFAIPGVNLDNLFGAQETLKSSSGFVKNTIKSYLARIQYDFSNRYTLTLSGRYDGSSNFAEGFKWGFFPSAGVAWTISNEQFLKDNEFLSNAKIRASYGETGNNQIGAFRTLPQAAYAAYILGGTGLTTGAAIEDFANQELTWETTTQTDVGVVLGFLNNKINLEFDYYNKETEDLLLEVPLPASTGFATTFENIGAVTNKGLEFSLNTVNVNTENFTWTSNFNISFNKNEVTNLGDATEFFVRAVGDNQIQNDYVVRVGEPLGSIFGFESDGVYQYDDFEEFDGLSDEQARDLLIQTAADQGESYYDVFWTLKDDRVRTGASEYRPGMPKFVDQRDEDGNLDNEITTDDRTIIGNTQPDHFGGFNNNFTYKNFDFSILTNWSYGNDIYNKNRSILTSQAIPFYNKVGSVRDRWTPSNNNSNTPGIWAEADGGFGNSANSSFIEDGSYLRISNITFGYKLPERVVKSIGISSFRLYCAIDNVAIFTNYSGFDPDVNSGNNQLTPGLDSASYPRSRTLRMGLNVGF